MDGHGRRGGPRLVEFREVDIGVYEAVVELEDGRKVSVKARLVGDILETPYGSYHISDLVLAEEEAERGRAGDVSSAESWLVEFDPESSELRAKLPVKVVDVHVSVGERVDKGDLLLLVETMKMVNEVHAPCSGVVEYVVDSGMGVGRGQPLARIKCSS
ncbi:acetyl-CoA carboxylase biotin carboxyl carrier protein subunit [Hyperthermus butylicus]|uniref:Lipoyl-binding domain-containing protein n=1 Tax=Hyperthermus butylicus (strain DSM 5456 / JCM 9403 / PLM1-5) TaxID=415426 RepID=A2BLY2_HYPBU|nr:acetyl-CoA carboxylase biotin carboxyl carrier protein subunit [Hyperthermus butylicus]ABM80993.1 hypothetical protein Hbut_1156 [Hyperthermus butylicus DSM 5456]